jgi:HK97 family phage major capsid protein
MSRAGLLTGVAGATPQGAQTNQLLIEIARVLERQGKDFSELSATTQRQLTGHAEAIARLNNDFAEVRGGYAERFHALAQDVERHGLPPRWRSVQDAQQFGRMVAALHDKNYTALAELQKAGWTPGIGAGGGWLLAESVVADIMRELDDAGVFLADCPPLNVNAVSGGSPRGSSGPTMYYPDYAVAGTVSTPGTGVTRFELKRHVAAVEVDQWMLGTDLAVALAEYVRNEIVYAVSLATDTNWFMGTGISAYCMKTGLFKLTGSGTVSTTAPTVITGDSGDDTFAKVIAKTTYYLAQMLGALPTWGHRAGPRFYMHPAVFFPFLGVRDTGGMPIASIYVGENAPALRLMGLPVRLVPVAPSVTATSTVFVLLAALARACRTYRHNAAIEFAWSDNLGEDKWLAGVSACKCDVPLDMQVRVPSGIVQLATHA